MKELMDKIVNDVILKTNEALKQEHDDTLDKFKEHIQTLASPNDKIAAII